MNHPSPSTPRFRTPHPPPLLSNLPPLTMNHPFLFIPRFGTPHPPPLLPTPPYHTMNHPSPLTPPASFSHPTPIQHHPLNPPHPTMGNPSPLTPPTSEPHPTPILHHPLNLPHPTDNHPLTTIDTPIPSHPSPSSPLPQRELNHENSYSGTGGPSSHFVNALQINASHLEAKLAEAYKLTPTEYHPRIAEIIKSYSDVFVSDDEPTGYCDTLPMPIQTSTDKPIYRRPYRVPVAHQKQVNEMVLQMQADKIIEPSTSPWHSPLLVVKKKDERLRLCIDFRSLNEETKMDRYPIPCVDEILIKVKDSCFFSTLDLKAGYHQVALAPEAREKTAFSADDQLFQFRCVPFGLRNAPAHFSRLMRSVLAGLIGVAALIYLDDICVIGETIEEHEKNLIKILDALRWHNSKVSLRKCQFFKQEITFLGHEVSPAGIKPLLIK